MTTVYLIRHSESFIPLQGEFNTNDSVQIINEKCPLSVNGEHLACKVASNKEFQNLDVVWSSNYVRAMATAKYFAVNNNLKVNVDDRLKERVQGITSWEELPKDFYEKQLNDATYKIGFGENQLEVRKRMEEVLYEIIHSNENKKIAIITHSAAVSFLLKKWCDINYSMPFKFNGKNFFDGNWSYCEIFKLIFDGDKLINIENIKL